MAFSKSLAALTSKVRSKVTRKSKGKVVIMSISAPYNVVSTLSPLGHQLYGGDWYIVDIYSPTSPYYEPSIALRHEMQSSNAEAEQPQPATSLSAQQQPFDLPSSSASLYSLSKYSDDASSEHPEPKEIPRCSTPSEQLFSPSAPASPNTSSRSTRTPSPIFNSVTSFDEVDSPTLPTITNDHFTELPSRVFPLRRTARVQRKAVPSSSKIRTAITSDPFATLFNGPSPSSSTHSLASLASFGDHLPLAKDIESGLVRFGCINQYTPSITNNRLDNLFAGPSPSCSVNSLAALTCADRTSFEEDIKLGVVSLGKVGCYSSKALPATPAVVHEGCFAIAEEW